MAQISEILYWLFNTRDGVVLLLGISIIFFLSVAYISEKKTKRIYYDHGDEEE